jgi:CheY-like chemotaxis protein
LRKGVPVSEATRPFVTLPEPAAQRPETPGPPPIGKDEASLKVPTRTLSILVVDDSPEDAEILRHHLSQIRGLKFEFTHGTTKNEALTELRARSFDLIFLDHLLGPDDGIDLLRAIRDRGNRAPVVGLSGLEVAAPMFHEVEDAHFVCKGKLSPDTLARLIERIAEARSTNEPAD